MDQRTRKLMMTLHQRDDIDRLSKKKEGRRGFSSIEDSVDASLQGIKNYIKNSKGSL